EGSERGFYFSLFTFHFLLFTFYRFSPSPHRLQGAPQRAILAHTAAVQVAAGQEDALAAPRRQAAHDAAEQLVADVKVVVHRPRLARIIALRQDKGVAER